MSSVALKDHLQSYRCSAMAKLTNGRTGDFMLLDLMNDSLTVTFCSGNASIFLPSKCRARFSASYTSRNPPGQEDEGTITID